MSTLPYWPAEWHTHAATWLAWPHNAQDWPGKFAPIPWVYTEIIKHLTPYEPVNLLVKNAKMRAQAMDYLQRAHVDIARVNIFEISTNRIWLRDSGPIFTRTKQGKTLTNWRFNAWAKYPNWRLDNQVPAHINTHMQLPQRNIPLVLEGGAIDGNGAGTLITTEECLLDQHTQCRNPGLSREAYETAFEKYLGIKQVLWLGKGIVGDDTHGHVDDLARFVAEDTIVTVVESNTGDDNYTPLKTNLQTLKMARNAEGKSFTVIELPMPRPIYFENTRLPASYANFYIANGVVLVPTFNDPNDRVVLNILAECFPTRQVIGIHALDLVWGFGTLHCMTKEEPEL